ncbi:MAG: single-stranded DNA-binding protein [Microgenomates group bacterium]
MASKSVNKVILIGNLTRDPELKYTPSGTAVCTFGVATNRAWTTAEGETKEDVQFHRIVAWQKLAELVSKLLTKGRKVYLEGRISYKEFVGKDGLKKNLTEIIMDDFVLFDDRRTQGADDSATTASAPTSAPAKEQEIPVVDIDDVEEKPAKQKPENTDVITDDDIPF